LTPTTKFPFDIKQSHPYGCIPTNISATLHALGIPGITENHMFQAYFSTICFENIIRLKVLEALPFSLNGQKLSDLVDLKEYKATSFEDWWNHVTAGLQNHRFVLFAFKINGDSHIRTAVSLGSSCNAIETYDPDPKQPSTAIPMTKQYLADAWSQKKLNCDLLSISRR